MNHDLFMKTFIHSQICPTFVGQFMFDFYSWFEMWFKYEFGKQFLTSKYFIIQVDDTYMPKISQMAIKWLSLKVTLL